MEIITISGIPGSGKTTLGKQLGKKDNCLSIELEKFRWKYFEEDFKNNILRFTNTEMKDKETYREYYLRCSIYDKNIDNSTFIEWNKETIKYINNEVNKIFNKLKVIEKDNDINSLIKFINEYKDYINYVPEKISLETINKVIVSFVYACNLDIETIANKSIILNESSSLCFDRFKNRENIKTSKYDESIIDYLNNCKSILKDVNKKDIRIKNDGYNFHYRVAGIIMQDNKFLIQNIDGYDYYILPGGHVRLGESSIEAIKREIREEVTSDAEIKTCNLICLHENFYNKQERREHWVEEYFLIKLKNVLPSKNWSVIENDDGDEKKLNFKWVSSNELKKFDLKPTSIKNILVNNEYNKFNFIIDGE